MRTSVVIASLLLVALQVTAADAPESLVKYRQSVMKALAADMNGLGLIVKGEVAQPRRALLHAESIAAHARDLPALFPPQPSSESAKSAAKREIWSQSADFRVAAEQLERESAKMVVMLRSGVAKSGDAKALQAQYAAIGAACGSCHKRYRNQD